MRQFASKSGEDFSSFSIPSAALRVALSETSRLDMRALKASISPARIDSSMLFSFQTARGAREVLPVVQGDGKMLGVAAPSVRVRSLFARETGNGAESRTCSSWKGS